MQLKAQLLSLHLPHKFAQTAQIQVASLTGRLLYAHNFAASFVSKLQSEH